ncbi:MAG: hypothetical protein K1X53_01490 [Candidatus Sumerlaeaceae bacterium]|nr:hypothetical protein [Candidatus Sumerlaeaceae bacterium]
MAVPSRAQDDAPAEEESVAASDPIRTATDLIGLAVIVIGLAAGSYLLVTRLRAGRYKQSLSDIEFENKVISALAHGEISSDGVELPPADEVDIPITPAAPTLGAEVPTENPSRSEAIVGQLRSANLIASVEGFMEIHGDSRAGTVVALKNGKRALIIEGHESEAFTSHNLRRFDYLIYINRNGKAVMLRTLESFIADGVKL